jgi:signal transduction histidine kinase
MSIDSTVPKVIFQDEQRIGQVLVNIMNNAVKYTFNGTVSVTVEVIHINELKVVIKDSGKGIDKMSLIGQWFGNLDIVENVN